MSFGLAYMENMSGDEGIRAFVEPCVILLILVLNAIVGVWCVTHRPRLTPYYKPRAAWSRAGQRTPLKGKAAEPFDAARLATSTLLSSPATRTLGLSSH